MKIRLANYDDAQFIALLGRITFTETFDHLFNDKNDLLEYLERTFSVGKIRSSLNKPNNVFWLAFVNDLPVAYAKLKLKSPSQFLENENISQLQKIYVLKDFLSMKVGKALQNQLLKKAKENGAEKIWLSVLKSNERAIGSTLKMGSTTLEITIFK